MRVSIIGAGYVGLVTGVCLAEKGHTAICVDVDSSKVETINRGVAPIYERGLDDLLARHVGRAFSATTDLHAAVQNTDVTLIAVGTPFDGSAIDLRFVRTAATHIGTALRDKPGYHVVAVKSTVVPGTTEEVVLPLLEQASGKRAGDDFGVGMSPEFLSEGEAVHDCLYPDRIVLGGIDERTLDTLDELFAVFEGAPRIRTNTRTAEMIKYAANALQATLISFSNEIANLCAAIGDVDVVDVMHGVHLSRYLTMTLPGGQTSVAPITSFLHAGCGFGGSCFPKDVKALIAHGARIGQPMTLLDAVIRINEAQPGRLIALLRRHFPDLNGVCVAVLGLAFKPGTDDMRESPAIPVVRGLLAQGARVRAYDPQAKHEAEKVFGQVDGLALCDTLAQALDGVQAAILVTRWDEFRQLPDILRTMTPQPLLIDGRRLINWRDVARYEGIGR